MTDYTVKRFILALEIQAVIEGMKVANAERGLLSEAPAYSNEDFIEQSFLLGQLAAKHDERL